MPTRRRLGLVGGGWDQPGGTLRRPRHPSFGMPVSVKRIHHAPTPEDGYRVLVDRLWPRGISRQRAALDLWLREVAPSDELRRWFGHAPERWPEFQRRYFRELRSHTASLAPLIERAASGRVTLLHASREERANNAVALKAWLERPAAG